MTIGNITIPSGNYTKPLSAGLRFWLDTSLILNSTKDYTLLHRPSDNFLVKDFGSYYNHTMTIAVKTGNKFDLPINALIPVEYNTKNLVPGNYFDVVTINMDY